MNEAVINSCCRVTLHFSIALEDGKVVDASDEDDPIIFVMGDGSFQECLELTLYSLKPGDEQQVVIEPGNGFGFRDNALIHRLLREDFEDSIRLKKGMIVAFEQDDAEILGTILDIQQDVIVIDFNHPLAGHTILFRVFIVEVEPLMKKLH